MADNIAFDHSRRMDEKAIRIAFFFPAAILMAVMAAILGGAMSYEPSSVGEAAEAMGAFNVFLPFMILLIGPAIGTQIREGLFIRDVYLNHGGKINVRGNKEALIHIDSNSAWNDMSTYKAMLAAWLMAMAYGAVLIRIVGTLTEFQGDDRWWVALGGVILFIAIAAFAMYYNRLLQDFASNGHSNERGTCSECKKEDVYLLLDPNERRMKFLNKWVWRIGFLVIGVVGSAVLFGFQTETLATLADWGLINAR